MALIPKEYCPKCKAYTIHRTEKCSRCGNAVKVFSNITGNQQHVTLVDKVANFILSEHILELN